MHIIWLSFKQLNCEKADPGGTKGDGKQIPSEGTEGPTRHASEDTGLLENLAEGRASGEAQTDAERGGVSIPQLELAACG